MFFKVDHQGYLRNLREEYLLAAELDHALQERQKEIKLQSRIERARIADW